VPISWPILMEGCVHTARMRLSRACLDASAKHNKHRQREYIELFDTKIVGCARQGLFGLQAVSRWDVTTRSCAN